MGQKLFEDKIPTLTEAGGTITMPAGARLTIGGQQYITSSPLNVAANVSSGNTRYQVYAILNAGNVELVVSSNENSVGPAGAAAWKLVGSYYTNNSVVGGPGIGLGSFINVDSKPATEDIVETNASDIVINSSTGATIPSISTIRFAWRRDGEYIEGSAHATFSAADGAGGAFGFQLPFTADTSSVTNIDGSGYGVQSGNGFWYDDSASANLQTKSCSLVYRTAQNNFEFVKTTEDATAGPQGGNIGAGDRLNLNFRIKVQGWDNTPIKDL